MIYFRRSRNQECVTGQILQSNFGSVIASRAQGTGVVLVEALGRADDSPTLRAHEATGMKALALVGRVLAFDGLETMRAT